MSPAAAAPFDRRPRSGDLVDEHLTRTGLRPVQQQDPLASLQVNMLRDLLRLAEMAMEDEDLPTSVITRVVRTIIYGALPTPTDVQVRIAERGRAAAALELADNCLTVNVDPETLERVLRRG